MKTTLQLICLCLLLWLQPFGAVALELAPTSPEGSSAPSAAGAAEVIGTSGSSAASTQGFTPRSRTIVCTPRSVSLDGQPASPQKNPLAFALSNAAPGCQIRLESGTYPSFGIGFGHTKPWNGHTRGGTRGLPIRIFSNAKARIAPETKAKGDTIAINNSLKPGHIIFENIEIEPGYRAAVIFYKGGPTTDYPGFQFIDCDIVGGWNHLTNTGSKSTWGIWAYGLSDFVFKGLRRRATVSNLRKEHGFYLQNCKGDVLIENVAGRYLGRTFCQFTARSRDGLEGKGNITLRNCQIEDVGIAATDAYKGGSAMTFSGRLRGTILIEDCTVKAGFNPKFKGLTRPGVPYGTGALVCWDGHDGSNKELVIRNSNFSFAPGCGDRSLVSIGACDTVRFEGRNRLSAKNAHATLALDPMDPRNAKRLGNSPNKSIWLPTETIIEGPVTRRGKGLRAEQRKLLALSPAEQTVVRKLDRKGQ